MKKRIFAAIASVMMLGTILAMPVSAAETYQKGDVNMDGKINLEDAMLVLQDYVEQIMYNDGVLTEQQRQLGNVDNQVYIAKAPYIPLAGTPILEDIEILDDVLDARYILQYYVATEVTHQIDSSTSIEEFINQ